MPQCQHPPPSQAHVDVSKATIIDPAQVLVDSPEPWATKMITGLYEARKKKGMTEEQEATAIPGCGGASGGHHDHPPSRAGAPAPARRPRLLRHDDDDGGHLRRHGLWRVPLHGKHDETSATAHQDGARTLAAPLNPQLSGPMTSPA